VKSGEYIVRNQINLLFVGFILLISSGLTQAQEVNPYQMLQDVAMVTFERIKSERDEIDKNPEKLRTVMEEELLPHVDYNFSALKVLGKHFRTVPKEKVPEFIKVFREYLITTYALALAYYNGQEVVFQPMKEVGSSEKTITVRAVVKEPNRPDINIAFKLRKNSKTNEWKAYDMVAEGISLLSSKQSEFAPILRKDGIQAVIDLMNSKIERPINLEEPGKES
jgi:phospholipid transport system substrate-binding protein